MDESKKIYMWTAANCLSGFGDGFTNIAMSMMTYSITASGKYAAIVFLAGIIPSIIFGPIVGLIIDSSKKTSSLVGSNLISIGILLGLILSPDSPWIFFIGNFLLATTALFFRTASRVVLPELTDDKDKLMRVNSMYSMANKISRVIGMTFAGFASEIISFRGLYLIDALSFILCIVIVIQLKEVTDNIVCRECKKGENFLHGLKEGSYIYTENKVLLVCLLLFGGITMCDGVLFPHLVVYVREHLKSGGAVLGQIQSLFMIGTISGQMIIMKTSRNIDELKGVVIGVFASAVSVVALGIFESKYAAFIIIFIYGLFGALIMTSWITISQRLISVELRGRGTTYADAIVKTFNLIGIGFSIVLYGRITITQEFLLIGLGALIFTTVVYTLNLLYEKRSSIRSLTSLD